MTDIENVARELDMRPNDLLRESLKTYLETRLLKIETEICQLTKKHEVKDIVEFDKKAREGLIPEEVGFEDFFRLDYLEAERDKINKILEEI